MGREFIIYADESVSHGQYFSNFYGGALVRSTDLREVEETLQQTKARENLHNEIKWTKVTATYLSKYVAVIDAFFDLVEQDKVKVRVMFTQNSFAPTNLTREQRGNSYFLLYYQFIKHAFGLQYSNEHGDPIGVRLYLDRMPDSRESVANFRGYLLGLNRSVGFRQAKLQLREDQIAEVDSHDHVVLQVLDVVLGAMPFRLNDQHKQRPPGAHIRGKRTIAKDNLYQHIRGRICRIRPNFNVGVTTGVDGDRTNYWRHGYRHWRFIPREWEFLKDLTKNQ